jgi:hypothetical protein
VEHQEEADQTVEVEVDEKEQQELENSPRSSTNTEGGRSRPAT